MSEHSTPEERTEMPTDKRWSQLRERGQLFTSNEITLVVSLSTGFLMLGLLWQSFYMNLRFILEASLKGLGTREIISTQSVMTGVLKSIYILAPTVLFLIFMVASMSALSVLLQTGWNVKKKKIDFRTDFLNPINGIKRIFSISGLFSTGKALAKLFLILPIAYFALSSEATKMIQLIHMNLGSILTFTGEEMTYLFWKILYVLIGIALVDYFWGRFQWFKVNKMTKEEVKDERKAIEGDETTRRRIIAKGLQRIMQRIRQSVPKADVVVTNPTHYSVALQYDRENMKAPTVVAKGKGFLALRIREIAKEHGVPILERKTLARALYSSVEVGNEIPFELFKAVAEVLAYVYRIRRPSWMSSPQEETRS